MKYLELEEYERKARNLRQLLKVDDQFQPDLITVLIKLKSLHLIKNYERVPDCDLPGKEASWDPDSRILKLRESIFCGANQLNPASRPRFTIAHELGHMWLDHTMLRDRSFSDRAINKIAPTIKRDERQANSFAAAFLVPAHLIENPLLVSAEEIAGRFNMSIKAAELRKEELERMYRRANNIPRPLPRSITDFLNEKKRNHGPEGK